MKATWNGEIIAESANTLIVEGNHYFPSESIKRQFFKPSLKHTTCPWKGIASYYNVDVDNKLNEAAAWFYPEPKEAAKEIKDHVAFWKGVEVTK